MSETKPISQIIAKKAIAVASSYGWEREYPSNDMWYYNGKRCLHVSDLVEEFTDIGTLFAIFYNECRPMMTLPLHKDKNDMIHVLLELIINDFGIKLED